MKYDTLSTEELNREVLKRGLNQHTWRSPSAMRAALLLHDSPVTRQVMSMLPKMTVRQMMALVQLMTLEYIKVCTHEIISVKGNAVCKHCFKGYGKICPTSPDNVCHNFTEQDGITIQLINGRKFRLDKFVPEYEQEDRCFFCGGEGNQQILLRRGKGPRS